MKIEMKRRYILLTAILLIFLASIFTVAGVYDPTKGSHDTLWTNTIEPKDSDSIEIVGNVGIGTANPGAKLDIAGTARALAANHPAVPTSGKGIEIAYDESPEYDLGYILSIDRAGDVFKTLDIQGNPLLLNKKGGNVGIGTMKPIATLEVKSSAGQLITATGTEGNTRIRVDAPVGRSSDLELSGGGAIGNGWSIVRSATAKDLEFRDGGSPPAKLLIQKGTGNVGIGTMKPEQRFEVKDGNIGISNKYAIAFRQADNGNYRHGIRATADNALAFETGNFIERMRITDGGNIGIGTTNPIATLEVKSRGGQLITATGTEGNTRIRVDAPVGSSSDLELSGGGAIGNGWSIDRSATAKDLEFRDGGYVPAKLLIQKSTGNVGIGKTNPSSKLDVAGDIKANGTIYVKGNQIIGSTRTVQENQCSGCPYGCNTNPSHYEILGSDGVWRQISPPFGANCIEPPPPDNGGGGGDGGP